MYSYLERQIDFSYMNSFDRSHHISPCLSKGEQQKEAQCAVEKKSFFHKTKKLYLVLRFKV